MKKIEHLRHEEVEYWRLGYSPIGAPQMYVHCFWIDGVLLDTGQRPLGPKLVSALQDLPLDKILLTHHHEDHTGNIGTLTNVRKVPVYGSAYCQQQLTRPERVQPARLITWGQNKPAQIDLLDISQTVDTNLYSLLPVETPGHAYGHLSFFEKDTGRLFSGDVFVNDRIKIFMKGERIELQIASIKKLLQLDFDTLFCCHQPVLSGGKQRLANKLDFLENYLDKVRQVYAPELTAKDIMAQLNLKEDTRVKLLSLGHLSVENMVISAMDAVRLELTKTLS